MEPIYITGMGMNCSLGWTPEDIHQALLSGVASGISDIEILSTRHRGTFPVGEIKRETEDLRSLVANSGALPLNRTTILATLAVENAIEQARYVHRTGGRLGLISGTTVGGMDASEDGYIDHVAGRVHPTNFFQVGDCAFCAEFLADRLGGVNYLSTISTACSSSLNAIGNAVQMLRAGQLDVAIAGGADALCRFTINGFNSFMLLDQERCRPFDASRSGINLGEGAAYFVLETAASLRKSGNEPLAMITGYGNHNDRYHPSSISPVGDGIQLAMSSAINEAGLKTQQINYVLTHGTATPNNDASEGAAIEGVFSSGETPAYISLKSSFGHTLAASGALNTGVGITSILTGTKYASYNWSQAMPELSSVPLTNTAQDALVNHVIINATGMGGYCSSMVLSKS
ncbi:beta-ketoacyl-[acyl-carrier-protein] synthase family protein [Neolewinella lacunae]|uniref:Beta-ketoacyl-[acyl-carrier-protein] synthase family protein n=1 Tax=Neolewinella lacunae TaxID=1517758 RepID=A0A923PLZ6_9BACT|nr:beta-ketoacyl-[acyl-carrier-protein] synthase family protein [Neolewinella lacunae]MBC6996623.1 beta-ketoacyl-[acyl-carrier-protein] synthase family protein [Neolewinella lacunae]MDN3634813.1 beta-ketoacyl-[acyl-carrier-protein] synthase family protein [Neolewinella lacunae]